MTLSDDIFDCWRRHDCLRAGTMRLTDLDYNLPPDLVAQEPLERRDEARLMVLDRRSGTIEHSRFYKLGDFLRDGDLLVLNDTRVFPARLFARKPTGGSIELLMVRPVDEPPGAWLALIRGHRGLREGTRLMLDDGHALRIARYQRPGRPLVTSDESVSIETILESTGALALPHYIRREPRTADRDDYQTVYASQPGAVAAPTAGLHFTRELLATLATAGVRTAFVTLHIGPGTFTPLRAPQVEAHTMEAEWYTIPPVTLQAVGLARRTGARVIAVGTSSVRALESHAITGDAEGATGLFISPGFRFRATDAMVTNFHMPRSTVLAMVMALAGREEIFDAYRDALRHRYRFLSYGDAMLIL
ncbi:MAG: tRNA preQ1(34) S-adenosylmethionine ribosyltransferase-isomerase QueA [Candidatus Binataceae bacterium]